MADSNLSEQFYNQVSDSIKMVFDLTSRIDERVKMLIAQQKEADQKIEKVYQKNNDLMSRIVVLESKDTQSVRGDLQSLQQRVAIMESSEKGKEIKKDIDSIERKLRELELKTQTLSMRTDSSESKWAKIIDFVIKLGWAVLAAYILYKLGLPEPM